MLCLFIFIQHPLKSKTYLNFTSQLKAACLVVFLLVEIDYFYFPNIASCRCKRHESQGVERDFLSWVITSEVKLAGCLWLHLGLQVVGDVDPATGV